MLIKKSADFRYSEITPKSVYLNRRKFLAGIPAAFLAGRELLSPSGRALAGTKLANLVKSPFSTTEKQNTYDQVSHYNNFYEFGTRKDQPAQNATNFKTDPWTVSVEGDVAKPRKFTMDEILKLAPLEERIYRHRCVEGWSIVVPWVGYSLSALLKQVSPRPRPIRGVRELLGPQADAAGRRDKAGIELPLRRRLAAGRGHAPAGAAVRRHVRRDAAAAGRRAGAAGGALEVRLQEHQIDREDQAGRAASRRPPGTWPTPTSTASTPT